MIEDPNHFKKNIEADLEKEKLTSEDQDIDIPKTFKEKVKDFFSKIKLSKEDFRHE